MSDSSRPSQQHNSGCRNTGQTTYVWGRAIGNRWASHYNLESMAHSEVWENPTWEVKAKSISRDGFGLCMVGQPRYDQERLLWAWEDCNWQHFCATNQKSTWSNQGQMASQVDVRCAADAGQHPKSKLWRHQQSVAVKCFRFYIILLT